MLGPLAQSNQAGILVRNLPMMISGFTPSTESMTPVMPTSVMVPGPWGQAFVGNLHVGVGARLGRHFTVGKPHGPFSPLTRHWKSTMHTLGGSGFSTGIQGFKGARRLSVDRAHQVDHSRLGAAPGHHAQPAARTLSGMVVGPTGFRKSRLGHRIPVCGALIPPW